MPSSGERLTGKGKAKAFSRVPDHSSSRVPAGSLRGPSSSPDLPPAHRHRPSHNTSRLFKASPADFFPVSASLSKPSIPLCSLTPLETANVRFAALMWPGVPPRQLLHLSDLPGQFPKHFTSPDGGPAGCGRLTSRTPPNILELPPRTSYRRDVSARCRPPTRCCQSRSCMQLLHSDVTFDIRPSVYSSHLVEYGEVQV